MDRSRLGGAPGRISAGIPYWIMVEASIRFLVAARIIVVAGAAWTRFADGMADRTRLGRLLVGSIFLAVAIETTEDVFLEHGPPLVLKSDNGNPFIAQVFQTPRPLLLLVPFPKR